jgi:hypothetical protein
MQQQSGLIPPGDSANVINGERRRRGSGAGAKRHQREIVRCVHEHVLLSDVTAGTNTSSSHVSVDVADSAYLTPARGRFQMHVKQARPTV